MIGRLGWRPLFLVVGKKGLDMKSPLFSIVLSILLAVSFGGVASACLCDFADIAVYGVNTVDFDKNANVTGNVVANSAGGEVALDKDSTVTGDVKGDTIDLGRTPPSTGTQPI